MNVRIASLVIGLMIGAALAAVAAEPQANYFVAPDGDDAANGSLEKPFKTLARARDAVRAQKTTIHGDIRVLLRGGQYDLTQPVIFGVEDGGREGQMICYEAYPGETPVFSSGVRVSGWKKAGEIPGLAPEAQGKVWVAELPRNSGLFHMLYDGEKSLPRARGKGFAPTIDAFGRDKKKQLRSRTVLYYPQEAPIKKWSNLDDIEIVIRPWALWVMNILPLKEVDETKHTVTTKIPGTYFLTRERYNRFGKESVWVENTLEGMTRPGNWCVNARERKLYYWPESGVPGDDIYLPTLTEYIRIEGRIDPNGPVDIPVRHLAFKGLTFIHGERAALTASDASCQHDWELYDKDSAYLRLRGAENCMVDECEFKSGGNSAIRLDLYAQHNTIRNNYIHHLGGTGIFIGGYGPGRKDVNKCNQILNNHIHDIGQIYWMSAAILLTQSGENRIAHNLIHDTPYNGMAICGYRPYLFHHAFRDAVKKGTLDGTDYSWAHFWSNTEAMGLREIALIRWDELGDLHDFTMGRFETGLSPIFNLALPFIHSRMNIVENNEIHDVMKVLGDGNGIYISDTGPANVLRHNYIHHVGNSAIRTDAHQRDCTIYGNIVFKCGGGICCYNNNQAYNNIIALPVGGQNADGTPKKAGAYYTTDHGGFPDGIIQRNIVYIEGDSKPTFNAYQKGDTQKQMQVDYNLVFCADDVQKGRKLLEAGRALGLEQHSISEDPLFVDVRGGDFRLSPESPAIKKLGFQPLDVKSMGLSAGFPARFVNH